MSRFGMMPYRRGNDTMLDMFDAFDRAFFTWPEFRNMVPALFRTDIKDTGGSLVLQAELPGVDKESIGIKVEGDMLHIRVEQNEKKEAKHENYVQRERINGVYARSFDISGIDAKNISASYEDGMLIVTMPKLEEAAKSAFDVKIA